MTDNEACVVEFAKDITAQGRRVKLYFVDGTDWSAESVTTDKRFAHIAICNSGGKIRAVNPSHVMYVLDMG